MRSKKARNPGSNGLQNEDRWGVSDSLFFIVGCRPSVPHFPILKYCHSTMTTTTWLWTCVGPGTALTLGPRRRRGPNVEAVPYSALQEGLAAL